MLSHHTGATFVLCVVNMTCNTAPSIVSVVTDRWLLCFIKINMLGAMSLMLAVWLYTIGNVNDQRWYGWTSVILSVTMKLTSLLLIYVLNEQATIYLFNFYVVRAFCIFRLSMHYCWTFLFEINIIIIIIITSTSITITTENTSWITTDYSHHYGVFCSVRFIKLDQRVNLYRCKLNQLMSLLLVRFICLSWTEFS